MGSTRGILAAGAVSIAVALISIFILFNGSKEKHKQAWPKYAAFSVLTAAGTTIASIVGLVYSMVDTYSSSTLYHGPLPDVQSGDYFEEGSALGRYGNGTYSLEGWTCQTRQLLAANDRRGIAEKICQLSVSNCR